MRIRKISHLPLSVNYTEYLNWEQDKIEIVNCSQDGQSCKRYLSEINKNFLASSVYHLNKEYSDVLHALKNAFNNTDSIQESDCSKCNKIYRSTIIQTLSNIHSELKYMSSGFFKKKSYQENFKLADNLLQNFINITTSIQEPIKTK